MLPYSLKVAWAVLALTGLISCWITLLAFSRAIGTYWAPVTYCVACTMMQVIFCLGLIWKMDPYEMPRGFCIAQSVVIASAAYVMATIASTCSGAISLTVLSPRGWSNAGQAMLEWRRIFFLPVVVFPTVATVIHVMLIYKFDAVQPSDDLHCDDTHPEWVRFFGYAAMPFVLGIPCAILSIMALIAVHKTSRAFSRAQHACGGENLLSSGMKSIKGMLKSGAPTSFHPSVNVPSPPPSVAPFISRCRIPFLCLIVKNRRPPSFGSNGRTSSVSTTIPVFRVPVNVRRVENRDLATCANKELEKPRPALEHVCDEKLDDRLQAHDAKDELDVIRDERDPVERRDFGHLDPSALSTGRDLEENIPAASTSTSYYPTGVPERNNYHWPPPNLNPAFWRIMIFQIAYTAVQVLACISTIIDVAKHRSQPTPFGMQHIALQLSAWGPCIIFGHLPAVRRNIFRRRS